jgi:hypothetical protein
MKIISKEFLNSIDEVERKELMLIRRYVLIAFSLTVFRFCIGALFKLAMQYKFFS